MKHARRLAVASVVVAAGAAVIYVQTRGRDGREVGTVRVSGNIEVIDADLGFKIAGRVERRLVDEGETVRAGQVVALLDRSDLEADVATRDAALQEAQAALAELEAGSRPDEIAESKAAHEVTEARLAELVAGSRPQEIREAEARLASAVAEQTYQENEQRRYAVLLAKGSATQEEFDRVEEAFKLAEARRVEAEEALKLAREGPRREVIEQARAARDQARARFNLVRDGPRKEEIARARAKASESRASLGLARTRLGYATLTSPLTGIVLSKDIEPGEFVAPGTPVVTVADIANVFLRAYVNESDLGRVKVGQAVRVTADTYPGKVYNGRISFIASEAEFTPKNVQTEKQRVKLVYRIKIAIKNPEMELKPGMPADAEIIVGPENAGEADLGRHPR